MPSIPRNQGRSPARLDAAATTLLVAAAIAAGVASLVLAWASLGRRSTTERVVALTQSDARRVDRMLGDVTGLFHDIASLTPDDATVLVAIPPEAEAFRTVSRLAALLLPRRVLLVVPGLSANPPGTESARRDLRIADMIWDIARSTAELAPVLPAACYVVDVGVGVQLPNETARDLLVTTEVYKLSLVRRTVR